MAYLAAGTLVGYSENPYNIDGNAGVSRKLSVSTGDAVEVISVPEDVIQDLGLDAAKLRQFGRPVVCRVRLGAFGGEGRSATLSAKLADIRFLANPADLIAFGYEVEVYVPDAPAEPAPLASVPNGKSAAKV